MKKRDMTKEARDLALAAVLRAEVNVRLLESVFSEVTASLHKEPPHLHDAFRVIHSAAMAKLHHAWKGYLMWTVVLEDLDVAKQALYASFLSERQSVIQCLTADGQMPAEWQNSVEEEFRNQVAAACGVERRGGG
ncbi:MAG: hypothetical protein ACOYOB_20080 [Myxococcota bacterium]